MSRHRGDQAGSDTPAPIPGSDQHYATLAEFTDRALRLIEFVAADLQVTEGRQARLLAFIAATVEAHVGDLARALREESVPRDRCCHPSIALIAQRADEPGAWEGLCASCGSSVVVAVTREACMLTRPVTVADLDALDQPEYRPNPNQEGA